jgi:hypothetical protein
VTGRDCGEEGGGRKYVEIGNDFYLKMGFCEREKQPIRRVKIGGRSLSGNYHPIPFPRAMVYDEYLHYQVDDSLKPTRII